VGAKAPATVTRSQSNPPIRPSITVAKAGAALHLVVGRKSETASIEEDWKKGCKIVELVELPYGHLPYLTNISLSPPLCWRILPTYTNRTPTTPFSKIEDRTWKSLSKSFLSLSPWQALQTQCIAASHGPLTAHTKTSGRRSTCFKVAECWRCAQSALLPCRCSAEVLAPWTLGPGFANSLRTLRTGRTYWVACRASGLPGLHPWLNSVYLLHPVPPAWGSLPDLRPAGMVYIFRTLRHTEYRNQRCHDVMTSNPLIDELRRAPFLYITDSVYQT
jgi:hypothetical protein